MKLLAQNPFGQINLGPEFKPYGDLTTSGGGILALVTNVIRLMFVMGGVWALFNIIIAGYMYMNAGGDTKALNAAWAKIWQSLLGLVLLTSSFAIAGLFGYIIFGDAGFILNPKIYGPK